MTRRQRAFRLLRPLFASVLLGGAGALVNYLLLSPVPAPVLYLGGLFYLPILIRFGTGYGLLCAVLTQLPLTATLQVWLPFPELIVLGWLIHRRQLEPIAASLRYWLTLGLACSAYISFQTSGWDLWTRLLAALTPPLTGLVMMTLTRHTLAVFQRSQQDGNEAISHQLGNLLIVFSCLPVLAFHVIATPIYTREQLNQSLREVEHAEQIAHERYNLLVERNLRGLVTISEMIGTSVDKSLASFEPFINRVVGNLQEVFTIVLIDQDGYARGGAPDTFPDGMRVADADQFYGDRDYFVEAKRDREPAVSYGIIGRRMNPEPLLSMVAPILTDQQQFRGVVLGNLPLRRLHTVFTGLEHPDRFDGLIYDRKQQILFSTERLQLPPLAALSSQTLAPVLETATLPTALSLGDDLRPYLWQGKLVRHASNEVGGGMVLIFALLPDITAMAVNSLLTLLVLLGVIFAARLLSQRYSGRLLRPLLDLHRHLQQLDPTRLHQMQPLLIESSTREINELVRSFNAMMVRIAKGRLETDWAILQKDKLNLELDHRIAERTEELAKKAAELELLSVTDSLTGLYNRRHLTAQLQDEWTRLQRNGGRFAVMLFDVDHFKQINDRHGHPAGDEVLRQIGLRVRECIRNLDTAARYGGEEFAVLLPGIDASHALVVAERLRVRLAELSFNAGEVTFQFTVSIGVCDSDSPGLHNQEELLQRADQALYRAKQNGRNRCLIWTDSPASA
ncbi:GGDEF domain-containing protein [Permianibacter sp. IMCC34836]|uniref:sensor domain-containing diguanylate cyclase n=1 Tax=Permianibacter fluminis TaxID=2738515 RepID=UPI0015534142|nr:GGDEF domain-containing protein [Permianibacter fluminis]NQD37718.1 GGDEF domain-containing protein [Permianibacter fluminis]